MQFPLFESGKQVQIGDSIVYNDVEYKVERIELDKDTYTLCLDKYMPLTYAYDTRLTEVPVRDQNGEQLQPGYTVYTCGNKHADGTVWIIDSINSISLHPLRCHMFRFPEIVRDLKASWVTRLQDVSPSKTEDIDNCYCPASTASIHFNLLNINAILRFPNKYSKEYNIHNKK